MARLRAAGWFTDLGTPFYEGALPEDEAPPPARPPAHPVPLRATQWLQRPDSDGAGAPPRAQPQLPTRAGAGSAPRRSTQRWTRCTRTSQRCVGNIPETLTLELRDPDLGQRPQGPGSETLTLELLLGISQIP
jgi:hypothetical protein